MFMHVFINVNASQLNVYQKLNFFLLIFNCNGFQNKKITVQQNTILFQCQFKKNYNIKNIYIYILYFLFM